ncbi:hypothetical protein [Streptomyces chrestomyceticus]|uniref:hypothetical protein n=1 Tax=Streptomyces chrestomyceticus TaxID=68185 RepID=UPI0033CA0139
MGAGRHVRRQQRIEGGGPLCPRRVRLPTGAAQRLGQVFSGKGQGVARSVRDYAGHGERAFTGPLDWYRNNELPAAFQGRGPRAADTCPSRSDPSPAKG